MASSIFNKWHFLFRNQIDSDEETFCEQRRCSHYGSNYSFKCNYSIYVEIRGIKMKLWKVTSESWYRIFGRDLRRALIQPAAQSRVRYEVRLHSSGLWEHWKAQRWGLHSLCLTEPLLFQLMSLALILPPCTTEKILALSPEKLLLGAEAGADAGSAQTYFLPKCYKCYCLSLSIKGRCQNWTQYSRGC